MFLFINITPFKNVAKDSLPCPANTNKIHFVLGKIYILLYIIHRHIYIYVRVFLQISASLHDNAKLARVGVARAAPAHGLTELFLIKYFALLYVRSNITLHDPFLRIIIWTT